MIHGTADAKMVPMNLPERIRKLDLLRIDVDLELIVGGILAVVILRWLM